MTLERLDFSDAISARRATHIDHRSHRAVSQIVRSLFVDHLALKLNALNDRTGGCCTTAPSNSYH
jgi:hypothetical protein